MPARVKHSHNYELHMHTHTHTYVYLFLSVYISFSLPLLTRAILQLYFSFFFFYYLLRALWLPFPALVVLTRPVFNVSPGLTRLPPLVSRLCCFLYVWQRINFKCPVEATKCIRVCACQMKCPAAVAVEAAGAGAAVPSCPTCVRVCIKANQQNSK